MKRNLIWGVMIIAALPFFSSCGEDEPAPAGLTFELEEQSVTESSGELSSFHPDLIDDGVGREILVKLVLDKPLAKQSVVKIKVSGTASSVNPADEFEVNDYEISDEGEGLTVDDDQITIEKGVTEASFKITVFEDYDFEYDEDVLNDDEVSFETIIITLESVVSGPVKLGAAKLTHTLNIDEDDAVFILEWGINNTTSAGDVDLDLLFWLDNQIVWGSASEEDFEAVNFPAGYPNGNYGVSYPYYAGTANDVDFVVGMFGTSGTLNGRRYTYPVDNPLVFGAAYTLANINKWSNTSPPKVVQTMVKNGINFTNISAITVPAEGGSRVGESTIKFDRSKLNNVKSIPEVTNGRFTVPKSFRKK